MTLPRPGRQAPLLVDQLQSPEPFVLDATWCGARVPAGLPAAPGPGPVGSVVLLSRRADAEFSDLQRRLALLGVPVIRLDADDLAGIQLSVHATGEIEWHGCRVVPTVAWVRLFDATAIVARAGALGALQRATWPELGRQIAALAPAAIGVPTIGLLEQHRAAAGLGVDIPRGVVTTNPAAAAAALTAPAVVVKALGRHFAEDPPGTLSGVFPQVIERTQAQSRQPPPRVPVMVQEYVPHDREIRIYLAGGSVRAFEVVKPSPDAIWRDPDAVSVRLADPPPSAAAAVGKLAAHWGLRYGAFDFLMNGASATFLEVNLDGGWRWFEARAGTRQVSDSVAMLVRDLHVAAGGSVRPGAAGGGSDLVGFLTTR